VLVESAHQTSAGAAGFDHLHHLGALACLATLAVEQSQDAAGGGVNITPLGSFLRNHCVPTSLSFQLSTLAFLDWLGKSYGHGENLTNSAQR
jgi:hypothetical protein